ncbi:MAG TPA: immunoglobulin domain-containing protein [Verrucomicrobiae bacterium]|nr:immunoglobulin domain-containing protein [Verrucomicrobiae bacterium]
MKTKTNLHGQLKALLVAGLLAAPLLASNARAQGQEDNHWAPVNVFVDGNGNQYAYFDEAINWSLGSVPTYTDAGNGNNERVIINGTLGIAGTYVACYMTNNANLYQIIMGYDGTVGGGNLVLTNGAQVQAGVGSGQWTGIAFPNGPSTLYIGPGCNFTCGSHLWVGQGTNNGNPAVGTVIIDGGSLNIPNGQLGVGWNGTGGTNFLTLTNGGKAYLQQWAGQTLGQPGNNSLGILDLADNQSEVIITNVNANDFTQLEANNQLVAYGGQGTVQSTFNPTLGVTILHAVPPVTTNTPVISSQPSNVVVSVGGTATFFVGISNVPVTYQWLFNGNPLANGGGISGAQTATLTISGVTPAEVGNYSVVATNTTHLDQYVTSQSAGLSTTGINLYPVITINGIPNATYVTEYTTSLTPPVTWIPFATNTLGSFAPFYIVDTSTPMSVKRFYQTIQQH